METACRHVIREYPDRVSNHAIREYRDRVGKHAIRECLDRVGKHAIRECQDRVSNHAVREHPDRVGKPNVKTDTMVVTKENIPFMKKKIYNLQKRTTLEWKRWEDRVISIRSLNPLLPLLQKLFFFFSLSFSSLSAVLLSFSPQGKIA